MRNVVTPGRLSNTNVVTLTSSNGFESFSAQGVKEALDKLDDIIDGTKAAQLKNIFDEGAQLVAGAIRSFAPEKSPATTAKEWPSIREAVFVSLGTPTIPNVLVGVKHNGAGSAPQALWMEYGTAVRKTGKGKNRGAMPPKPFFRKAIDSVREDVAQFIGGAILDIVNSIAGK